MKIEIRNWKEVVEQFGLQYAVQISKRLQTEVKTKLENSGSIDIVPAIPYNPQTTEAVVLFELAHYYNKNNRIFVYDYTGTAN